VPQAEWLIATDVGFHMGLSNLTLCALTNTHALTGGVAPTVSCDFNTLPLVYADPVPAAEPGGSLYPGLPGLGTKQIAYRGGRLSFALPIALSCGGTANDGIAWYVVDPQLTTISAHNPQLVNGIVTAYSDAGYWCFTNADSYLPTFVGDQEGDAVLSMNASSANVFPSIVYTGRMAVDAPGTLGQGGGYAKVFRGTTSGSFTISWGEYSACALTTNQVTRGTLFCAGEYGGTDKWNTGIYQVRMQ
jgi:hypothetical protein